MTGPVKGSLVWVPGNAVRLWETGTVLGVSGKKVVVVTESGRHVNTKIAHVVNPKTESDMTSLHHIHEPGILVNIEQRALKDEPYTLMGPVLVAVNPLKRLADPKVDYSNDKSARSMATCAHPFGIAESAYQQFHFSIAQSEAASYVVPKKIKLKKSKTGKSSKSETADVSADEERVPVNQSIIVSGESGAGKTESSKMVLRHLVARCSTSLDENKNKSNPKKSSSKSKTNSSSNESATSSTSNLDSKLLGTNPILESFGNASTLRNSNSSRFGKLLKLHLSPQDENRPEGRHVIVGASIDTYLLERSRVSAHQHGERGYHVFYQLLSGSSKAVKKSLSLSSKTTYTYLSPASSTSSTPKIVSVKQQKRGSIATPAAGAPPAFMDSDSDDFVALNIALHQCGFKQKEIDDMWKLCAAILHLGNMAMVNTERSHGDVAVVSPESKESLRNVVELLGAPSADRLMALLVEKEVIAGGENMITFKNAKDATLARDAVAKAIYARLFDWIIYKINVSLSCGYSASVEAQQYVGVLDIFGFESFQRNDFEQLLIAYCNEMLQATFDRQVFTAEAELYKREGLTMSSTDKNNKSKTIKQNDNTGCLELLQGPAGIFAAVISQGQVPQPSDTKLVASLHQQFSKSPFFAAVHPREQGRCFAIEHYAGQVTYTVGSFLRKNNDALPSEVEAFLRRCTNKVVKSLAIEEEDENVAPRRGGKKKTLSVMAKFKQQMGELVRTLESTQCHFIRCLKPNARMERMADDSEWFERKYVSLQLKCLSVPQTAAVLRDGLPTRLAYAALTEVYKPLLPKDAIKSWKVLGKKSEQALVAAVFWAFEIPREDYKLGLTKCFFRSGKLAVLDNVLQSAATWSSENNGKKGSKSGNKSNKEMQMITKRIKHYFARRRWRVCLAMVISVNVLSRLGKAAGNKKRGIALIQSHWRGYAQHKEYVRLQRGANVVQRLYRGRLGRQRASGRLKSNQKRVAKAARKTEKRRNELEKKKKEKHDARRQAEKELQQAQQLLSAQRQAEGIDDGGLEGMHTGDKKQEKEGKNKKEHKKNKKQRRKSARLIGLEAMVEQAEQAALNAAKMTWEVEREHEHTLEKSRALEEALMDACQRAEDKDKQAKRRLFKRYQKAEALINKQRELWLRQESRKEGAERVGKARKRRSLAILTNEVKRNTARKAMKDEQHKRHSTVSSGSGSQSTNSSSGGRRSGDRLNKRMSLRHVALDMGLGGWKRGSMCSVDDQNTDCDSQNSYDDKRANLAERTACIQAMGEVSFWADKLAVKSHRNWRRRYIVLNIHTRTITYHAGKGGSSNRPKGNYQLNDPYSKSCLSPEVKSLRGTVKGKQHVVELRGGVASKRSSGVGDTGRSGVLRMGRAGKRVITGIAGATDRKTEHSLFLSFEDEDDKDAFVNSIKIAIHGELVDDLDKRVAEMAKLEAEKTADPYEASTLLGLDMSSMDQLELLDDLLQKGEIDEEAYDRLLPTLVQGGNSAEDLNSVWGDDSPDEVEFGMQVNCQNDKCNMNNNTMYGLHCRGCGGELLTNLMQETLW